MASTYLCFSLSNCSNHFRSQPNCKLFSILVPSNSSLNWIRVNYEFFSNLVPANSSLNWIRGRHSSAPDQLLCCNSDTASNLAWSSVVQTLPDHPSFSIFAASPTGVVGRDLYRLGRSPESGLVVSRSKSELQLRRCLYPGWVVRKLRQFSVPKLLGAWVSWVSRTILIYGRLDDTLSSSSSPRLGSPWFPSPCATPHLQDEQLPSLHSKEQPINKWDDEDVDGDEIKESWENDDEPAQSFLPRKAEEMIRRWIILFPNLRVTSWSMHS